MNIWFAVDNIDLLEDTPNRQNIIHGTVIVINQRNVNGEPVNKPLVIPGRRTIIIQIYHMGVGKEVMPTWAATRPLLLSNTHESITRTNTEVIAPLFKPSATNITTLYTVLMLRQVVSAVVVGPERKTIITFDLDLFIAVLFIFSRQLETPTGSCKQVFCTSCFLLFMLGKTLDGSDIDTLIRVLSKVVFLHRQR